MLLTYDDVALQNIQTKADKLRDVSDIDIHTQLHLWKETVHFRRQCIRDKLTSEILKEFPGYSNQLLVILAFTNHFILIKVNFYCRYLKRLK